MTNEQIKEVLKQSEQTIKQNYIDLITRVEITTTMMQGLLLALKDMSDRTISTDSMITALERYIKELEL